MEVEDTAQLSLPKWLERGGGGEWGNLEPLCRRGDGGVSSLFSNDPLEMKQRHQVTQLGNRVGRGSPGQYTGKPAWVDGTNPLCYEPRRKGG